MASTWADDISFLDTTLGEDSQSTTAQAFEEAFSTFPASFQSPHFDSATELGQNKGDSLTQVPRGHIPRTTEPGQKSTSPESSVQDSSSENSSRHKRKNSSDSSPPAVFDTDTMMMDDAHMQGWKQSDTGMLNMGDAYAMRDPDYGMDDGDTGMEDDFEMNKTMANHFDFESAGSSPTVLAARGLSTSKSDHILTAFRPASARTAALPTVSRVLSRTAEKDAKFCDQQPTVQPRFLLGGSRESSPASPSMNSKEASPVATFTNTAPAASRGNLGFEKSLNDASQTPVYDSFNFSSAGWSEFGPSPSPAMQPQTLPATTQAASGSGLELSAASASNVTTATDQSRTWLAVGPISTKSRVETQIGITLTLYPMPTGVTKIHLPTHTISKPKLLAKQPVEKSADMLELHTMLVCTSAMKDPEKRRRAFARAAAGNAVKREARRNSTGDMQGDDANDPDKPLNGGEVQICSGCITRERKRAARKKVKKAEEEDAWAQDEDKRAIVFNTNEIKAWQQPDQQLWGAPDGSVESANLYRGPPPEGAMQVHAPMRIACYCRHHSEKFGFQVIFTIKDHEDRVVAQAICHSIMITDDHKTHGPAALAGSLMIAENHLAGAPLWTGAQGFDMQPAFHQQTMPFRYSHSTNDLQRLRHNFVPPASNFQAMDLAPINTGSQTTSATMTPRNLSRPASPSAHGQPSAKKRRGSGAGHHKIPTGLTMTRLETSPLAPQANATSAGPSTTVSSAALSPFSPSFASGAEAFHIGRPPTVPHQYCTGPPTPISNTGGVTPGYRSHSNENFPQAFFSAPSSAHHSRAPSPTSFTRPKSSYFPQQNQLQHQQMAQAISNLSVGLPTGLDPQNPPVIHKLIPGQGPIAGSVEVTCLGRNFCQGLDVMFGNRQATTTTFWGDSSLVCLLPPSPQAGTVPVTFKHAHQGQVQYPSPSPPQPKPASFTYVDDEDNRIYADAIRALYGKEAGNSESYRTYARQLAANAPGQFNFVAGANPRGGPEPGGPPR